MQSEPTTSTEQRLHSSNVNDSASSLHHGFDRRRSSASSSSVRTDNLRHDDPDGVNPDQLEEKLRGLSLGPRKGGRRPSAPGQRISDYENALTPPTPKQALGFKVIKRSDTRTDGVQIEDFPNGQYNLSYRPSFDV